MIDLRQRHAIRIGRAKRISQNSSQRLHVLIEPWRAGQHRLLKMLFVPHGPAGDLRIRDRDQNRPADVAHEVDETGDLVALLPGHAHVGRGGD